MKKLTLGFLTTCLAVGSLFAGKIDVITKVESVTIYHSGALVKRTAKTTIGPGMNELIFKNISSKIILNSLKINNKKVTVLNKTILNKLSKEEYNQLIDRKKALENQLTLIESKYKDTGFIKDIDELTKMIDFYAQKVTVTKRELRNIEKRILSAKDLEDIELKNKDAAILKLIVSVDGQLTEPLAIQYVCGGIGWSPAYEITVNNSSEKTIEVKYLAKAMSQTGEDWNDVTIKLSSSFPLESPTRIPKPQTPWLLKGNGYNYTPQSANQLFNQQAQEQQIDKLDGVIYKKINVPSFLKLRVLKNKFSIQSNSTVFTFPIQTVNLPAQFYYYGFPSIDPEVYLVAQLTEWDALGFVDGIANISFNGNDVGKSVIKFSESKDTLLLPIGKDNSVFMKRSEMADQKYFKVTTLRKKRETTLAYRYELKNNNAFPIQFKLYDQVPISQTKSADVEMIKTTKGKINKKTGEIKWIAELKPGETANKELIFTISMDASYSFYNNNYEKKKSETKYRSVSAPSF